MLPSMDDQPLSPKIQRFVLEWLKDMNGTQAAIRAGYKASAARTTASELLAKSNVQAAIRKEQEAIAKEIRVDTIDVLRGLLAIVEADPNELVEHRRTCCRNCWSFGLGYKRTPGEMRRAREAHDLAQLAAASQDPPQALAPFDEQGGDDYDATMDPDPDCDECFGEGVSSVFLKDTRSLSPNARALYAGVKQTKEGVEVKMHSKEKARELIGRHLGMFTDVIEVNDPSGLVNRIVEARRRAGGK